MQLTPAEHEAAGHMLVGDQYITLGGAEGTVIGVGPTGISTDVNLFDA